MHVEFLVEEPSAEAALNRILPVIFEERATYRIHTHQGKPDLLRKLPRRLLGYQRWLPTDWRIVVLIDEDREDCRKLKQALEEFSRDAGLWTRQADPTDTAPRVLNRIAVEELEAWFFGDPEAICAAYPRVPDTFSRREAYRDPDAIRGGTWEARERLLQRAGYYATGLPKIEVASRIAESMSMSRNRSESFQVFRDGLLDLIQAAESS